MRANGEPLTIFGDGLQRRDFIHVSDVVTANVSMTYTNPDNWGEVYNIGYGENWSIQELADKISKNQVHLSARAGEMKETLADISKAKHELAWRPKVNIIEWIDKQL